MFRFERYKKTRFWAVHGPTNELITLVVYLKGAKTLTSILNNKVAAQ